MLRCLCRVCCSNTGLDLGPGTLSQSVPLLRLSLSTGLASSQLQAWQCLLRRLPKAQRRLLISASHCHVSLLTCHAVHNAAVLCCAQIECLIHVCCHGHVECLSANGWHAKVTYERTARLHILSVCAVCMASLSSLCLCRYASLQGYDAA